MRIQLKQAGFSGVEAVIILVIAGVIGGVGYSVYHRDNKTTTTSSSVPVSKQTAKAQNVSQAPSVQTLGDLSIAANTLDKNDPSSTNVSDLNELDNESLGF